MTGQALKRGTQRRVGDAVGGGLDGLCGIDRKIKRVSGHFGQYGWRLHFKQDPGQAGEFVERLQLALQALLLIAQAGGPVTVSDDQQQAAFAP